MRLIDADELVAELTYLYEDRGWHEREIHFSLADMRCNVEIFPKVVPKHGHWIDDWDIGCSVCSECDDSFLWEDFNGVREFNYCPTCGAKMER